MNYSCDDGQQFDPTLVPCVGSVCNHSEDDDNGNQNGKMVMMYDVDSHACTMCRQCWPSRKYRLPPGMDGNLWQVGWFWSHGLDFLDYI